MTTDKPLPQPQAVSFDEKIAAFDSVPLFMKSLPEDATDDAAISALQNLAYEGTPDEIAQNFKEQGNDYFTGKRYREAIGFYTQGIDAKPTDGALIQALLGNRAACNLELKNYGSVLRDCSSAITINSQSSKAYYRSSLALMALDRFEEALDCCDRCLQFDPNNPSVQAMRQKVHNAQNEKVKKEMEKLDKVRKQKEEKKRLHDAFKERGLIVLSNQEGGSDNPYKPHLDPEDSDGNTLIFPVFFLYPQHATSDVISHFVEDTPFTAHVSAMFPPQAPPPEWDKERQYVDGQLSIYATTRKRRLLKVGKKMTLRDVCNAARREENDGLELKDGYLTFVVLPKGDVEKEWIEGYKATRPVQ